MKATVYVDGSYSTINNKGVYGGGIVLLLEGVPHPLFHTCNGDDTNIARLRNVAGELLATISAVGILKSLPQYTELEICYDYEGIEKWVTGEWQAKKAFTIAYKKAMLEAQQNLKMTFKKIAAHTGDEYNEKADKSAKEAVKEYARNIQSLHLEESRG